MKVLETEIQISAPPERVWAVLTDLEKYQEWNPFIREARGQVKVGDKLTVRIFPPDSKAMEFKPVVKSVVENREFSWLGRFLIPGLFDGEHIFQLKQNESGTLLIQKEHFSGMLVPLLWKSLDKNTRAGFEQMNRALKDRAETAKS